MSGAVIVIARPAGGGSDSYLGEAVHTIAITAGWWMG